MRHMKPTIQNHYRALITRAVGDVHQAQQLRRLCFGVGNADTDQDAFDDTYQHVLIYDDATDMLVCTFRFIHLQNGADVMQTYSGAYYDLSPLLNLQAPLIEMGQFCVHPDRNDPNILRYAWSILTQYVDQHEIALLFGCSSFAGTDVTRYGDTFAMLKQRYLAPPHLAPVVKSAHIHAFGHTALDPDFDVRQALKHMPSLLRTYLAMGGRVSDHAVLDYGLNTIHVFTAVEIDKIPTARKRWLRASVI